MLAAFLIIHTITYSGQVQTLSVFRYPDMMACEQARSTLIIQKTEKSTEVAAVFCTSKKLDWWRE